MKDLIKIELLKKNNQFKRILLFTIFLLLVECYQFNTIWRNEFITGDFGDTLRNKKYVIYALITAVVSILLVLALTILTNNSNKIKRNLKNTWITVLIFFLNYFITDYANIGNVIDKGASYLSIIATLIPINYLILSLSLEKFNFKFLLSAALFIIIDIKRILLGAVLKIVYIFFIRAKKLYLFLFILMLPLFFSVFTNLITFKLNNRGINPENFENLLIDNITTRLATVPTYSYAYGEINDLTNFCHSTEYASQYIAAILSIIPKKIFGIEYVKTYNNCLIEYRLGKKIDDSSVNSPYLLNIVLNFRYSLISFIYYLFLTILLIYLIIRLINKIYGFEGLFIKFWVLFEFFSTGNILHLTIPLYFFVIVLLYEKIKIFKKINY